MVVSIRNYWHPQEVSTMTYWHPLKLTMQLLPCHCIILLAAWKHHQIDAGYRVGRKIGTGKVAVLIVHHNNDDDYSDDSDVSEKSIYMKPAQPSCQSVCSRA